MKSTYLGKGGEVFGPFSEGAVRKMRESGELSNFTFIWNEKHSSWENLEALPPPPPKKIVAEKWSDYDVFTYFSSKAARCRIEEMTVKGATLIFSDIKSRPFFSSATLLNLNLLNEARGKSIHVKGRVQDIFRSGGNWCCRITWTESGRLPF